MGMSQLINDPISMGARRKSHVVLGTNVLGDRAHCRSSGLHGCLRGGSGYRKDFVLCVSRAVRDQFDRGRRSARAQPALASGTFNSTKQATRRRKRAAERGLENSKL